jgi:hypothetical protein
VFGLAWKRISNLHVTEDRIQSLARGIVGELFVPDNRPRQDQQFGATEACRELELITGNVDAGKQYKWSCCYFLDFVQSLQVDFIFTPWRKQAKTSFRKYSFFSEDVLAVLA